MRRKNRVIKVYLDIPEEFDSDEDFLVALANEQDDFNWQTSVVSPDGLKVVAPIHSICIGDVQIDAGEDDGEEEEEEDDDE